MRNRMMRGERVARIIIVHHPDEHGDTYESVIETEDLKPNQVIKRTIKLLKSIYKRKNVFAPVELKGVNR